MGQDRNTTQSPLLTKPIFTGLINLSSLEFHARRRLLGCWNRVLVIYDLLKSEVDKPVTIFTELAQAEFFENKACRNILYPFFRRSSHPP